MKLSLKRTLFVLVCFLAVSTFLVAGGQGENGSKAEGEKTVKAGFVYVGPVGDYGWSYAHEIGRQYIEEKFPWFESIYVESVPEGDSARIIDRFVNEQKCDVVLTTSFGYMDDTLKAAQRYPDTLFAHCSGFKRNDNMGTYFAELYQIYYLNGMMAGALTKTNKLGYVGAFPISEVIRHINAFALGAKAVNPDAEVSVRWINSWYDPAKAKEAAEALVAEGIDTLAFTEDSPAVIEVGQNHTEKGKQIYTFGHYSPMQQFGEDTVVSGQLVDWGIMYEKIFQDIYDGKSINYDLWWRAGEGAAVLGGNFEELINSKFVPELQKISVNDPELGQMNAYDAVMKKLEMVKSLEFDPFTGPIADQKGAVRIQDGEVASQDFLISIDFFVDNVKGTIPQ